MVAELHFSRVNFFRPSLAVSGGCKTRHSLPKSSACSNGQLSSHTSCRLGLWYQGAEAIELYGRERSFQQLEEPHRLVHESARLALEAAAREQWREVLAAIDAMESASLEVS
ncbi:MAG: hypothetical protein E6Q71_00345, partial [Pseudomonas sp.]